MVLQYSNMIGILLVLSSSLVCIESHQYMSFEELEENNMVDSYPEINKSDMMKMKFLNFDGTTSLFVAYSNKIAKVIFDEATGKLQSYRESAIFNLSAPPWSQTYQLRHEYSRFLQDFIQFKSTYDTCLSFLERNAVRPNDDDSRMHYDPKRYNYTYQAFGAFPSNFRSEQNWVRFNDILERHHCFFKIHIRGLAKIQYEEGKYALWVCGSFSTFPKSFLVDPDTLELIESVNSKFYDTNVMTCARWLDETMVVASIDNDTQLYIGSGWGLYRPSLDDPDVPYNNSTMLYSDWKMVWNGYFWPTRMAMVLGRDVRFIDQYYETEHYLYFFGHEINPQYSYLNSLTRQSFRSFMLRVCKNDTGFNYTASDEFYYMNKTRSLKKLEHFWTSKEMFPAVGDQTAFSYTSASWGDAHHFPTKHFTSAIKFPFACYIKRFEGAQSLNYFWGEQNMLYFNRLAGAQLSFNWTDESSYESLRDDFQQRYFHQYYVKRNLTTKWTNLSPNLHVYNGMVAAFSSDGFTSTAYNNAWNDRVGRARPSGAVCQFQVSEWKTDHLLSSREPLFPKFSENGTNNTWGEGDPKNQRQYMINHPFVVEDLEEYDYAKGTDNLMSYLNMKQEFFALYGTLLNSFYTKGMKWFEGMQPDGFFGIDFMASPNLTNSSFEYLNNSMDCGKCRSSEEIRSMTKKKFETLMNHSSMAWPTDWLSYLTKYYDAFFHLNPMAVAGDNASFFLEGVEFMKMISLETNFTNYKDGNVSRPLLYMALVSTDGDVYRVVMCDLVSYPINISTCEMRNTDQPYLIYKPMTVRFNNVFPWEMTDKLEEMPVDEGMVRRARVSSLLSKWHFSTADDYANDHNRLDPQFSLLRDVQYDDQFQKIFLQFNNRILSFRLSPNYICPSYRTCVDCASDPFCGWIAINRYIGHGKCVVYDTKRSDALIQDVLGRGEQCYPLKLRNDYSKDCNRILRSSEDHSLIMKCNASSLLRGRVFWRSRKKGEEFHRENIDQSETLRYTFAPDDSLIIFFNDETDKVVGEIYDCIGIPFDGGKEIILASHAVIHQDDKSEKFLSEVDEKSYCPCMKTLTERLSRNKKIESIYKKRCNPQ